MKLQRALVVSCLFSGALAAPAPSPELKKQSFVVRSLPNAGSQDYRAVSVHNAYVKYGWAEPVGSSKEPQHLAVDDGAPAGDASGASSANVPEPSGGGQKVSAVTAQPESRDSKFLSPVLIGDQQFIVNFDTGSADLYVSRSAAIFHALTCCRSWVFATQSPDNDKANHAVYDKTKSKDFALLEGATFNITYAGAASSVHGQVGIDTVNVGGAKVFSQRFGLPNDVTEKLSRVPNQDGILGLGFSQLSRMSPKRQKSYFENIMPHLEQPLFTAELRSVDHGSVGTFEFGRIERSKYRDDLAYVPVNASNGFWTTTCTGLKAGETTISKGSMPTIADTGTTWLLMEDSAVERYYAKVQDSSFSAQIEAYIFPCSSTLPDLTIELGDYSVKLPGADLNYGQVAEGLNKLCVGALQNNMGQDHQIMGGPLFLSRFVVFDGGQMRLGMAPHV
ncbi:MAG: hypothetical protein M1832_001388 [Thelocarpon impressellum]|nr:MAG: hypothetical protein M1832_001388 [Thelocarpon impressellum]